MCQYHRRCKVGTHRPGTICPYVRSRNIGSALLVIAVIALLIFLAASNDFI